MTLNDFAYLCPLPTTLSTPPLSPATLTPHSPPPPSQAVQQTGLDEVIELALANKEVTRAAALSVFQLNLPRAISILQVPNITCPGPSPSCRYLT